MMFKNITGFFVNKKGDGGKKKFSPIECLIFIVVTGIVVILAGSFLTEPGGTEDAMNDASSISNQSEAGNIQGQPVDGQEMLADIERKLSELLSQVEGAGEVKVMVYADTSSEQVPAYNNEQDTRNDERTDGKSSEISETRELALSGDDTPVILKVMVPQIKGVVVVAEGADDMLIKEQMNNAVCTLLGIPEHRVQILKHK